MKLFNFIAVWLLVILGWGHCNELIRLQSRILPLNPTQRPDYVRPPDRSAPLRVPVLRSKVIKQSRSYDSNPNEERSYYPIDSQPATPTLKYPYRTVNDDQNSYSFETTSKPSYNYKIVRVESKRQTVAPTPKIITPQPKPTPKKIYFIPPPQPPPAIVAPDPFPMYRVRRKRPKQFPPRSPNYQFAAPASPPQQPPQQQNFGSSDLYATYGDRYSAPKIRLPPPRKSKTLGQTQHVASLVTTPSFQQETQSVSKKYSN